MWCMVMKFPVVVEDSIVRVIQLEQMLQPSRGLFLGVLDLVNLDR